MSLDNNWEELAKARLNPYNGEKVYNPAREINSDGMSPTAFTRWARPFLTQALATKVAASAMTNRAAAQQVIAHAEATVAEFLDDYCGTPPRLIPWPYPGPPPWVSALAAELVQEANQLHEGPLQAALVRLSGQVLDRVALNPQPLPP